METEKIVRLSVWSVMFSTGLMMAQTREPIARIAEQPIYEEDLEPFISGQLSLLRNHEYELKVQALQSLANQRLLETEARAKNLTADTLLEQTVDRSLPPVSAAEVEAYYLAQKDRLNNRPLNELKMQLEQALVQARRQQARQEYVDQLRQSAGISILLRRPKLEVTANPERIRGDADAPVTIVEFADFQCPYCQAAEATLKELLAKHQGTVRLGFRDFPLRQIHPQAQSAAEAARCAGDQGKFWEYHDLLFANQVTLGDKAFLDHARTAGMDVEQFDACLKGGRSRPFIENDLQSGIASGVSGTPAFYINGRILTGAQPLSVFEAIIESALAETVSPKLVQ